MRNATASVRTKRAATLLASTVIVVAAAGGIAAASTTGTSTINACFRAGGNNVRIVDHLPCRHGERSLSWNARGVTGAPGPDGARGATGPAGDIGPAGPTGAAGPAGPPGVAGTAGSNGADGQPGAAGNDGAVGPAGPKGDTGPAGPAGATGAQGPAGPTGPAGKDGAAGPAGPPGPAGSGGGGVGYQFGRLANNSDPDCAFTAPVGNSTAAGCSMTALASVGVPLPQAATLSNFVARFSKAQQPGHIYAMTADANNRAVDVILVCTIPAGSTTCVQAGSINLSAQQTFGLEFDGDRSWTSVGIGYLLSPR